MIYIDLESLHGRSVLVKSAVDTHNPPTAMRGSIAVQCNNGDRPTVSIALEYPQMFLSPAHHETIRLDEHDIEVLLASEHDGCLEFTIPSKFQTS